MSGTDLASQAMDNVSTGLASTLAEHSARATSVHEYDWQRVLEAVPKGVGQVSTNLPRNHSKSTPKSKTIGTASPRNQRLGVPICSEIKHQKRILIPRP
eukprot:3936673-Rhodomonas_salina.2